MKRVIFLFVFQFLFCSLPKAQVNIDTPNLGFEDGSLNKWKLFTGYLYYDALSATYKFAPWQQKTQALIANRIVIINNNSATNDPIVSCSGFYTNPDNKLVARIGVPLVREGDGMGNMAAAEKMEYSFVVTPNTTLLSYKLAAVLNSPINDVSHLGDMRPTVSLDILVKDAAGVTYSLPCGSYSCKADPANTSLTHSNTPCPGSMAANPGAYFFQKWISANIDLSSQIGKTVTISVVNHDCFWAQAQAGGHEAYGYFRAETRPIQLVSFNNCENANATIIAPQGFTTYHWTRSDGKPMPVTNPAQPWITTVDKTVNFDGITYYCEMNDANSSCGAITVSKTLNQVKLYPEFTSVAADAGKIQFTSTSTAVGDVITDYFWEFGDGTTSNAQNPLHEFNQYIPFDVKLTITSQQTCSKYIVHSVLPTKELTATIAPPANLVYNGQTKDFSATTNIAGFLPNKDYYIRYTNRVGTPFYNSFSAPFTVGDYTATFELSYLALIKYFMNSVPTQDFTITKAPLIITANNATKVYGDTKVLQKDGFIQNLPNLYASDKIYELNLICDGLVDSSSVGNYPIIPTKAIGLGVENYQIQFVNAVLLIKPKPLKITAISATKTYGDQVNVIGDEYFIPPGSLFHLDTILTVNLVSNGFDQFAAIGTYPIIASSAMGIRLSNYAINYLHGEMVVNKKKITVAAKRLTKTYGDQYVFTGKEFDTDVTQFIGTDSVSQVFITSAANPSKTIIGDYPLTITGIVGNRLENYDIKLTNSSFEVTPMPITVNADNLDKEYSDVYLFSGREITTDKPLITGDTILLALINSDGSSKIASIGSYDILVSQVFGAGLTNYKFNYVFGKLNVVKKHLLPALIPSDNLQYNARAKDCRALNVDALTEGREYSIQYTSANGYNSTIAPINVGDYSAQFVLTPSGLLNYELMPAPSLNFTITPSPLTVIGANYDKVYGDSVTNNLLKYSFNTDIKMYADDRIDKLDSISCSGLNRNATVGIHKIQPISVIGKGIENYKINFVETDLVVKPKTLIVEAPSLTKVYGDSIVQKSNDFYVDATELIANDTVLTVDLKSAAYGKNTPVGNYLIHASNASGRGLNNYQISYLDATIFVIKKKISIAANSLTKQYGSEYAYKGTEFTLDSLQLVGTDKITDVKFQSQASSSKTSVGDYSLIVNEIHGKGVDNYEISAKNGVFSVTTKPIEVIAINQEKEYDEVLAFSGNEFSTNVPLLNNDTLLYVFLSSAGTASQAQIGDYDIIPSQAFGVGSLNYDITYRPAKLKVIQKPLQVTALNAMKDYGDDDRELKFSAVDKRGVSYQPILFSGKLARDSGETVGVYKINKGTLTVAPSYSFNFTQGELTINKAMPSIAPLFSGGNAMSLISDIIGSKNGNYPKGNIIVKIKDVNIDTTAAVIDGVAKSQITELPNHMVQVEISYPGDEHYLPTSITIYVYALVYHSNGGRMITPYINFDGNQSVKIENPSNYGNLMFAGWYENEDFSGPEVRRIPAGTYHDVQLYAKWIPSYEDLYIAPLFNQVLAVANPLNHPFLANSTFKWYKDGELLESSKQYCGFENLIPSGKYKVEIYYLTQPPILLQLAYNSIISKSKAYPNPLFKNTTLSLNSEFANQDGVEVEVTNLIGVRIKSIVVERKDNRFIINGFERSGIYLLRIIDNGELKETHKVIVED